MKARVLRFLGLALLAGLWLWAAVPKIANPGAFYDAILGFRLIPEPVAVAAALYLPWLEFAIALGLLWPRLRRGSLVLTAGLMIVFGCALAAAWSAGLDLSCGCFGASGEKTVLPLAILRNLCLLVLSLLLLRFPAPPSRTSSS